MVQPYNYTVAQPQVSSYFDAFRQGRADRMAGEAETREKSLAQYLPGALRGDATQQEQALVNATPDQQIALTGQFEQRAATQAGKVAAIAFSLNTPEKWTAWLSDPKNRQEFGLPDTMAQMPFSQREQVIAKAQSLQQVQAQQHQDRSFGLEQDRLGLDRARTAASIRQSDASTAKTRAEMQAMRPQIGPDGKPLPPPVDNKQVDNEAKIRGEFTNQSKDFVTIRDSYQRVLGAAERSKERPDSAAGDLALIFSYMKILDPGSVVRETEFANAENAAGVDERTRALFNKVRTGEKLAAGQRDDFVDRARTLYKRALDSHGGNKKVYRDLAKRYNFDPERVAPDLSLGISGDAPPAPTQTPIVKTAAEHAALPSGAEYVDSADGKRYRKK